MEDFAKVSHLSIGNGVPAQAIWFSGPGIAIHDIIAM